MKEIKCCPKQKENQDVNLLGIKVVKLLKVVKIKITLNILNIYLIISFFI